MEPFIKPQVSFQIVSSHYIAAIKPDVYAGLEIPNDFHLGQHAF